VSHVIVLGGGLAGLAAAERLCEGGCRVTVVEQDNVLGGLAKSFLLDGKWIPVTYHHVMLPDRMTQEYMKKLGLWEDAQWCTSPQAFWYDGKEYLLSQPSHIFRFAPLSFRSKLRLLRFGMFCWLKTDWHDLDGVDCESWLTDKLGREIVEVLFRHLFDIKFKIPMSAISMAWLGQRLHQSVRNRDRYGCPRGGVERLVSGLAQSVRRRGGTILTGTNVTKLDGHRVFAQDASGQTTTLSGDAVLSTLPPPVLNRVCDLPEPLRGQLASIRYKPMISVVCGSRHRLSDCYWSVMLKPPLIFGGVFNHSVLCPEAGLKGENVYYLFTYLDEGDALLGMDEAQLWTRYVSEVRRVWPHFEAEWFRVFKVRYSQPVFARDYRNVPARTGFGTLYLAGVYRGYPSPRTMDSALRNGRDVADLMIEDLASGRQTAQAPSGVPAV